MLSLTILESRDLFHWLIISLQNLNYDFQALVHNDVSKEEKIGEVSVADNFRQPGLSNVTCNISKPINNSEDWLDKPDLQPEMFWTKDSSVFEFDEFNGSEERTKKFKETLCAFETNSKDSFYNAISFALIFKNIKNKIK